MESESRKVSTLPPPYVSGEYSLDGLLEAPMTGCEVRRPLMDGGRGNSLAFQHTSAKTFSKFLQTQFFHVLIRDSITKVGICLLPQVLKKV